MLGNSEDGLVFIYSDNVVGKKKWLSKMAYNNPWFHRRKQKYSGTVLSNFFAHLFLRPATMTASFRELVSGKFALLLAGDDKPGGADWCLCFKSENWLTVLDCLMRLSRMGEKSVSFALCESVSLLSFLVTSTHYVELQDVRFASVMWYDSLNKTAYASTASTMFPSEVEKSSSL